MTIIASHLPVEITRAAAQMSQEQFEQWASTLTPALPLGPMTINGRFDRYFHPHTQATWEGFQKAMIVGLRIKMGEIQARHRRYDIPDCEMQP